MLDTKLLFAFALLLIWGGWGLRKYIRPYFAKRKLKKWLDKQKNKDEILKAQAQLKQLYKFSFRYTVARLAKFRYRIKADRFLYGEIDCLSFIYILSMASPKTGEVFVDLGSGSGRAVFTAALSYPFQAAIGIEQLPDLVKLSKKIQNNYQTLSDTNTIVKFVQGDLLTYPLETANVVFINATAFGGVFWQKIQIKLKKLTKGTRVIINTHSLSVDGFTLIYSGYNIMSWGMTMVSIYQKE